MVLSCYSHCIRSLTSGTGYILHGRAMPCMMRRDVHVGKLSELELGSLTLRNMSGKLDKRIVQWSLLSYLL